MKPKGRVGKKIALLGRLVGWLVGRAIGGRSAVVLVDRWERKKADLVANEKVLGLGRARRDKGRRHHRLAQLESPDVSNR